ncbi:MAG: RNA polymerase factor sigma-54 [Bacteroidales bacterium]|nr:RNA polymerase factor sigma-54 [Bacteroidales bacterium]
MLNQRLQQKLLQKLSPQQILLMKLLQIPTMALEQRIKQEIEENPALEDAADDLDDEYQDPNESPDYEESQDSDDFENDKEPDEPVVNKEDEFDLEDYIDDDEIPDYKLSANNSSPDDEQREIPFASGYTFQEHLMQQLGMYILEPHIHAIALHLIGNLDDSGYLNRELEAIIDDLAFLQNIQTNQNELEGVLQIIQTLEPPGVGARSLRECLLLQLHRKPETIAVRHSIQIIDRYFSEFTKKHYDKIMKRARFTEADLKEAIDEILKLNPKPGNSPGESVRSNQYIIPDFIITNNDGELELSLNNRYIPELRVSRSYNEILETFVESKGKKTNQQKDAVMFVKQKIDSARWFIDAVRQRQNTLLVTMKAIMDYQRNYFLTGDETNIRPMILKDIAEIVGLDISTVSRVANSKYVQSPFGIFLLKSFFSESLQNDSGEEVSTREIKKILSDCVEGEDKQKPVTDEELMKILKTKGYNIARRTIAKYREQLSIPVARLRREL